MIRFGVTAAVAIIGSAMASDACGQLCPPAARLDLNATTMFRTGVLPVAVAPGCDEASQNDWTHWFAFSPALVAPARVQLIASSSSGVPATITVYDADFACSTDRMIACSGPCASDDGGSGSCLWFTADRRRTYKIRLGGPEGLPIEGTLLARLPGIESRIVVTRLGDEDDVFPPEMGDGSAITAHPGDELIITAQVRHVAGEGRYEGVLTAGGYLSFFDWPGAGELLPLDTVYTLSDPSEALFVRGGYWPAWSFSNTTFRSPTFQDLRRSVVVNAIQLPSPGSFHPTADGEWLNFYSARYRILDTVERDIIMHWALTTASPFYIRDDGRAWWDDSHGSYYVNETEHLLTVHVAGEVLACPCDVNSDLAVDIFDLIDYVNAYFDNDSLADFDADGAIDVFDLLGFLDCWMPASIGVPCR